MRASLGLVLLALSLGSCDQTERDASMDRRALQQRKQELAGQFEACPRDSATLLAGVVARSRCLDFDVPENPEEPQGRHIALRVMVIPAIRPLAEPDPFVILVGGPGQAATKDGLGVLPFFERIRQERDILLVDQRGTGDLSPLQCEFPENDAALFGGNTELLLQEQDRFLRECLAGLDADPRYYTTDIAVQDLDAIREHLGYKALNLWGVSYGTRVALNYLRAYPEHTRTVTLDGVAPPGILPLEAARDGGMALDRVLAACSLEPECNMAFPDLADTYAAVLGQHRTTRQVPLRDPATGTSRDYPVNAGTIQSALFLMLYSRETTRLIPLVISALADGDYRALAALGDNAGADIGIGMHYSVICSEDLPLLDEVMDETVFAYEQLVRPRVEGCKVWPSREMPAAFFEPVRSTLPVLLFSATQDPVTPPHWGDEVAASLGNALHVVASGVGHGVFAYGCAADLVARFVATARLDDLDTRCMDLLGPRPFFLTPAASVSHD